MTSIFAKCYEGAKFSCEVISVGIDKFFETYTRCIALTACLAEIFKNIIGFFFDIFEKVWSYFKNSDLPVSRTLARIGRFIEYFEVQIYEKYVINTPKYLKPVKWIVLKIIRIMSKLFLFIANVYPSLLYYILALLFWYTIGAPYILYPQENPALVNETIEVILAAIKMILNSLIDILTIFITFLNYVAPFQWQFCNALWYWGTLVLRYMYFYMNLKAPDNLKTSYNPFLSIGDAILTPKEFYANPQYKNNANGFSQAVIPRMLLESSRPHLQEQIHIFNRHLTDIVNNPIFSKPVANGPYNWGTVTGATFQAINITLFNISEIIFAFVYMITEVLLVTSSRLRYTLPLIINAIPNISCASENVGCAILELIVGYVEVIYNSTLGLIFGQINIPGCSADQLGSVSCECSKEEGGLFGEIPPCPVIEYVCSQTVSGTGAIIYSETSTVTPVALTQSFVAELGCPNSYSSTRRLLSLDKCFKTCFHLNSDKDIENDSWEFEVCPTGRTYMGRCNKIESVTSSNRKLIFSDSKYEQIYKDRYNILAPDHAKYNFENTSNGKPGSNSKSGDTLLVDYTSVEDMFASIDTEEYIHDDYLNRICKVSNHKNIPFSDSGKRTSDVFQNMICTTRRFIQSKSKRKTRNLQDVKTELKKDDFFIDRKINEEAEMRKDTPITFVNSYLSPLKEVARDLQEGLLPTMVIIEKFHDSLIVNHDRYLKTIDPEFESMLLNSKGTMSLQYMSIMNMALNHTKQNLEHFMERKQSKRDNNWIQKTSPESRGLFSRSLLSNIYDTGDLLTLCGVNGYLCPDKTCAKNNDPRQCKPCENYEECGSVIPYIHSVNTFFEDIDIGVYFDEIVECWHDITTNKEKNPANLYQKGYLRPYDREPYKYAKTAKFCFPLLPILPLPWKITFSWKKFLMNYCASNDLIQNSIHQCSCPFYFAPSQLQDIYSNQYVGISKAAWARLGNAVIDFKFYISIFVPQFISDAWTSIISFSICNPSTCPDLAYFFSYDRNRSNLTFDTRVFCTYTNIGSLLWSWIFFFYPLYVLLFYGFDLFLEIISLVTDPLLYLIKYILNYLKELNRKYKVEEFKKDAVISINGDAANLHHLL